MHTVARDRSHYIKKKKRLEVSKVAKDKTHSSDAQRFIEPRWHF